MSQFDDETTLVPGAAGRLIGHVHPSWNIGTNPNGGYLASIALAALAKAVPGQADPLSFTVHFLRPGLSGQDCEVATEVLRSGRSVSTTRATLYQGGQARLEVLAAFGTLDDSAQASLMLAPPAMVAPEQCRQRSGREQGVELPILDRLDILLHPDEAEAGAAGAARVSGWIRFSDGRAPDALTAALMVDAFPPSAFGLLGSVGWVPTIELTVHVRRRPAAGWMLGRFHTQDLVGDRLIEDGALWDSNGQLVAQSRQLALLLKRGGD